MKPVVIMAFSGNVQAVLDANQATPAQKIFLLVPLGYNSQLAESQKQFKAKKIEIEAVEIDREDNFEEIFELVSTIISKTPDSLHEIRLDETDGILHQILLSCAYIHGIPATQRHNGKTISFPILGYSYYDMLSEKKIQMMALLSAKDCCESLDAISKKLGLGPSLVNYHLYGNDKNPGLLQLGLVTVMRQKGKIQLKLTQLGQLLLKNPLITDIKKQKEEPVSKAL